MKMHKETKNTANKCPLMIFLKVTKNTLLPINEIVSTSIVDKNNKFLYLEFPE